jgi:hypothetical protein
MNTCATRIKKYDKDAVIMYKSKCMPYCQQSPNTIKSLNEHQFPENIVRPSKAPCPLAEKHFTVMNTGIVKFQYNELKNPSNSEKIVLFNKVFKL